MAFNCQLMGIKTLCPQLIVNMHFSKYLAALLTLAAITLLSVLPADAGGSVRVRGYFRKNGTYVSPHYRSSPDGIFSNNWSTKGNINPFTLEEGTRVTPPGRSGGSTHLSSPGFLPSDGSYPTYGLNPSSGMMAPTPLGGSANSPMFSGNSLDAQNRISTAGRLKALGLPVDWKSHSLGEMLDFESRISSANRLNGLGFSADWRKHSLSEMLDFESRISTANRLHDLGHEVNWQKSSLAQMLDWESRLGTANRLREKGRSVNWRDYSLGQLLNMEMSIPP
jgi:hypothetical protein